LDALGFETSNSVQRGGVWGQQHMQAKVRPAVTAVVTLIARPLRSLRAVINVRDLRAHQPKPHMMLF